jgi:hypothetical protein
MVAMLDMDRPIQQGIDFMVGVILVVLSLRGLRTDEEI